MSDIIVDRNQRFDLIAKLAASANGISTPEQQAIFHSLEVQMDRIGGDIELELEARRAKHNAAVQQMTDLVSRALKSPRRLAKKARVRIKKRKVSRVKRALKRSR